MNTKLMDECFHARMNVHQGRFSLEEFKRLFREQYERNGYVMIQPITNKHMNAMMIADTQCGFIFNSQRNLGTALRLLRLWGFSITQRREHDDMREYSAYIVQLPDDYLKHHLGSDRAGIIRTGLRNMQQNTDRRRKEPQKK